MAVFAIRLASAADRVALVIGNSAYQHTATLKNPKNDADAMEAVLARLGFEVVRGTDLGEREMKRLVREFGRKSQSAEAALLFYAGHGLQLHGRNYLVPVDAQLAEEGDLEFEALRLEIVLEQMERAERTNIILLDACRDNPLSANLARSMGTRSTALGRGLARIETGVGTFVGFATQPGHVAPDSAGKTSLFTAALVGHIESPGIEIEAMMRRVREEVVAATQGRQVPWSNSSLMGPGFVFKAALSPPEPRPEAKTPNTDDAADHAYWDTIKGSNDPALFKAYLQAYPRGRFASLAAVLVDNIERERALAAQRAKDAEPARLAERDAADEQGYAAAEAKAKATPKAPEAKAMADPDLAAQRKAKEQRVAALTPPSPEREVSDEAKELAYWNAIKASKDVNRIRAYLKKYPRGTFAKLARQIVESEEAKERQRGKEVARPAVKNPSLAKREASAQGPAFATECAGSKHKRWCAFVQCRSAYMKAWAAGTAATEGQSSFINACLARAGLQ